MSQNIRDLVLREIAAARPAMISEMTAILDARLNMMGEKIQKLETSTTNIDNGQKYIITRLDQQDANSARRDADEQRKEGKLDALESLVRQVLTDAAKRDGGDTVRRNMWKSFLALVTGGSLIGLWQAIKDVLHHRQ